MAKQKKSGGNTGRNWIVRIVIFGVLGVVLILALMDFRAKKQATETSAAWLKMFNDSEVDDDKGFVFVKDLKDGIVGSPEVTKVQADDGKTHLVYTWNGIFREYVVTVESETGNDSSIVNRIEGLGDTEAESEAESESE